MDAAVLIGKNVDPWGKIVAIGNISGERYYWFIARNGGISMMPQSAVDALFDIPHEPA